MAVNDKDVSGVIGVDEIVRVSTNAEPRKLAGFLDAVMRENGKVTLQVVGAGALNQAMKAIAVARGYIAPNGKDFVCTPLFVTVGDTEEITGMQLVVEYQK